MVAKTAWSVGGVVEGEGSGHLNRGALIREVMG